MTHSENVSPSDEAVNVTETRIALFQRIRRLIRVVLVVGTFAAGGQGVNLYSRAQEIEKSKIIIDDLSGNARDLFTITNKPPSNQPSNETRIEQTPQITEGDVYNLSTLVQQMIDKLNELPTYELGSIGDRLPHQLPVTEQRISELKTELQNVLDQLSKIKQKYRYDWDKKAAGKDLTNLTESFQHVLDFQKGIQEAVDSSQGQYSPELVETLKALAKLLELIATGLISVGLGMIAFGGKGNKSYEEKRKNDADDGEKPKRKLIQLGADGETDGNIEAAYQHTPPVTLDELMSGSTQADTGVEELKPGSLYAQIHRAQTAQDKAFGKPRSS